MTRAPISVAPSIKQAPATATPGHNKGGLATGDLASPAETRHAQLAPRVAKPTSRRDRRQYADRHGTCATRTQRRRPRWRLLGHHRGLHLRAARADAAVGALARRPPTTSTTTTATPATSATRSSCADACAPPPTSPRPPTAPTSSSWACRRTASAACSSELAKELRPWVPVVSLVKGLEQGTNMRMSQIVDEVLPGHPAGILAGPNIAREVAEGYAAAAVLAMPDQHLAANLGKPVPHQAFSHLHHRRRRRRRDGRCAEERLRDRRRHGLRARHRREHPRHGDGPRRQRDVQARRGHGRQARDVRRAGGHGRPHRHLHQPAQPQPPRRRAAGLGQDDRRDHRRR